MLILLAAKKKALPGTSTTVNTSIHPVPGTSAGTGLSRNAIGSTIGTGNSGNGPGRHAPGFIHQATIGTTGTGVGGTTVHPQTFHANTVPPVHTTGVNGTGMGHSTSGTIGGPAKSTTGVNGTSYRTRY